MPSFSSSVEMTILQQRKKDKCLPIFEKKKKTSFEIIPSFALFLDYLYCLGGDIGIFIKGGGFAKAQSSNQILVNTKKL